MENFDDDFGELYADVEFQANWAINGAPEITEVYTEQRNGLDNDSSNEQRNGGENVVEVDCGSDSDEDEDDDFDIVVNDDDFRAKKGGRVNAGEDEGVFVSMSSEGQEGSSALKNHDRVDGGRMEQNGGGCVGKNGCHSQYKFVRQHESMSMGNQRVISLSRGDKEDLGHTQNRRTGLGPVKPSHAGTFSALSEHGGGFWLPWNRTILDVDMGIFEQKPWTLPGADMKDYFNFGFDEESWKSYCQSLDQLRRQCFLQRQGQANRLRSKLEIEATPTDEVVENGAVNEKSINNEDIMGTKIGQAIHVEDSYIERQPSMDARPPRTRESGVVIEITMQDSRDASSDEKSDMIQKAKQAILEYGRGIDNVGPETEKSTGYMSHDVEKDPVVEVFRSPSASSELKRSYESGTDSSRMHKDSTSQGKGCMSKSDAIHSEKVDTFTRGYSRAVEKLNNGTEDANTNSADTNPCVAGIDVLFDDQIQSSPTPSDSVTWSKAPERSDRSDLKRISDFQRSSEDSVLEGPVVEYDHLVSRENERGDIKVKGGAVKRHSRARSPSVEDRKHRYQRSRKHSVVSNHSDEYGSDHIGIRCHSYDRRPLNSYHHRGKAKPHVSTFHEDRPHYRKRESSLGYYDSRIVEHKTSSMRKFYRPDHRGSRDELGLRSPRGWDKDTFVSETIVNGSKGEIYESERYLHEREGNSWDREKLFLDQLHFTSRYSDDIEQRNLRKDFDDSRSNMSRREVSLDYRYSDTPALERYSRPYPLNCRKAEYLDLEIERERRLQRIGREVGASCRGDWYLGSPPLDLDNPWYIREEDEDWNGQASRSTRDYIDRHHAYTERRPGSIICGGDVDDPQLFQKHWRHDRFTSHRNGLEDRPLYHHIDETHGRLDTDRYLDVDDYVVREQNDFQSKGLSWTEDERSNMHFHNDLYDGEDLDYFESVPRHKWHGTRRGSPYATSAHTQIMTHKQRIVRGGGDESHPRSKRPTGVENQEIGIWCKNAGDSRHVVRERKTVQPSGKCAKFRRDPDNKLRESGTNNTKEIRTVNIEAMNHDKLHTKNHISASDDLEEGQILTTEEPHKEVPKDNRGDPKVKAKNQEDVNVYDENRILETMAKMEKRRERFKDTILPKKETDSGHKSRVDPVVETIDKCEQQRPLRKRRWEHSKDPILPKTETDSYPKPRGVDPVALTAGESKQERPLRKRRWGGC